MTQTICDHLIGLVCGYCERHKIEPTHVWLALDVYRVMIYENYSKDRSTLIAHNAIVTGSTKLHLICTSCSVGLVVQGTSELETGEIILGREMDLINHIAERVLLCDTIGVSTVDTVTTMEKIKKEE